MSSLSSSGEVIFIIKAILFILALLICIITIAWLIYLNYNNPNRYNHKSFQKILKWTYCAIISFIFAISLFLPCHLLRYNSGNWTNPGYTILHIMDIISVVAWSIAQVFIYMILIARVHYGFINSNYELSKKTYWFLAVLLVLYVLAIIIFIIRHSLVIIYYAENNHVFSIDQIRHFAEVYPIGVEIIDLILSISLISLFIYKINQITVDLHDIKSDALINHQKAKLSEQQKGLLDIMTKCFILSFIATLSTQIESFMLCLYWIFVILDQYNSAKVWIGDFYLMLYPLDCIANSICLFLIFEINDALYYRICKGCHAFIRLCFKRMTKKRIQKKYKSSMPSLEANLLNSSELEL